MDRQQFRLFCQLNRLSVHDAGRNWNEASVRGAYLCAVIQDAVDFSAIQPLLADRSIFIASAKRYAGQTWFEYQGYDQLAGDNLTVARAIAKQYADFLAYKDNISHYSLDDIHDRSKAMTENPKHANESQDVYFARLEETQEDGCLAPLYVEEAGFYDENSELLLSDNERENGLWSYGYDNWHCHVIAVLIEQE